MNISFRKREKYKLLKIFKNALFSTRDEAAIRVRGFIKMLVEMGE